MSTVAPSLLRHLVRKDWRYLRWWFGALVLLHALPFIGRIFFDTAADSLVKPNWLSHVALVLTLVRLFQSDSVTGTTAFLLTRPVARLQLLSAKLILGVLIACAPFMVVRLAYYAVSSMAVHGLDYAFSTASLLVQIVLLLSLLLLPVVMTTRSLASLVVILLLSGVAWWLSLVVLDAYFGDLKPIMAHGEAQKSLWMLATSRLVIAQISVSAAVLVTVWFFYRRREHLTAGLLLVVLLTVPAGISYLWPWNGTAGLRHLYQAGTIETAQPPELMIDPAEIRLEFLLSARTSTRRDQERKDFPRMVFTGEHSRVLDGRSEYLLIPEWIDAVLTIRNTDQEPIQLSSGFGYQEAEWLSTNNPHVLLGLHPDDDSYAGERSLSPFDLVFPFTAATTRSSQSIVAEVEGTIRFSARHPRLLASAPLRLGTSLKLHRARLDIAAIAQDEIEVQLLLMGLPWIDEPAYRAMPVFAVVNREYAEVLETKGGRYYRAHLEYRFSRQRLGRRMPEDPLPWDNGYPIFPSGWIAGAEVIVLALPAVAEVDVPFRFTAEIPTHSLP